nr:hypothetical protein [uncultured Prevotella sp.]
MDTDMRIIALYKEYNMVIKPLIAELEARTEQFPLPLFNEIRALHDHIARCYSERISSNQVDSEIHKAERHVTRIMLDCYKCLNLSLHDEVLLFERQTNCARLALGTHSLLGAQINASAFVDIECDSIWCNIDYLSEILVN